MAKPTRQCHWKRCNVDLRMHSHDSFTFASMRTPLWKMPTALQCIQLGSFVMIHLMNVSPVEAKLCNDDHPRYKRAINMAKMTALCIGGICFAATMKLSPWRKRNGGAACGDKIPRKGHPRLHPSVVGWWRAEWDRRMAWDRHMNDDSA